MKFAGFKTEVIGSFREDLVSIFVYFGSFKNGALLWNGWGIFSNTRSNTVHIADYYE